MHRYRAYGLHIDSELELPEFLSADAGGDVVIRMAESRFIPPEYFAQPVYFRIEPDEAILSFQQIGFLRLVGGREITVTPEPGVDPHLLQLITMGHGMATLLFQRGMLALHASVVAIEGRAAAFIGSRGSGKSLVAAIMEQRGHLLLSDDVGAVKLTQGRPEVYPGFPRLKISPDAAEALGYEPSTLYQLNPPEDKVGRKFERPLPDRALPLKRVYLLTDAEASGIDPVSPQQAVVEIVRHSYPTRLAQPGGRNHFDACVALIRSSSLYRLRRPRDLNESKKLAEIIEQHLARAG